MPFIFDCEPRSRIRSRGIIIIAGKKRKLRELLIFVRCTAKLYGIARILGYSLFNRILGVVELGTYDIDYYDY